MFSSFFVKTGNRVFPKCAFCRELVVSGQRYLNSSSATRYNKLYSTNSGGGGIIGQTVLIVQDGTDVQELPYVVRNVSAKNANVLLFEGNNKMTNDGDRSTISNSSDSDNVSDDKSSVKNSSFTLDNDEQFLDEEFEEIVKGFKKCNSTKEMVQLLGTVPSNYVVPAVAVQILARMIELENEDKHHFVVDNASAFIEDTKQQQKSNFAEKAVCNQLMEVILTNRDPLVFVTLLKLMNNDKSVRNFLIEYKNKIDDSILVNMAENKYCINDICNIIKEHRFLNGGSSSSDKFWFGITEKSHEINHRNIARVFQTLPYLKKSRRIVLNTLTRRFSTEWWQVSGSDMAEILASLTEINLFSFRILQITGRWLSTNIHTVSEDELLKIVNELRVLEYTSSETERALERYLKAKYNKIRNASLIACIMDYYLYFRVRAPTVFDVCERYIIDNANDDALTTSIFKSLFIPFGVLHYEPKNTIEFWKSVESVLQRLFLELNPEHVLDIMLSCVYLNKYPINFMDEIFNSYFLSRIREYNVSGWNIIKSKLKILDTAMSLSCPAYGSPKLPKDYSQKSAEFPLRVKKMMPFLQSALLPLVDSCEDRIHSEVCLPYLPLNSLYIIDILLSPGPLNFSSCNTSVVLNESYVAVLIHLPEHYCSKGDLLIGPQVMRIKHLRSFGMKVINLNYSVLSKLFREPAELKRYIKNSVLNNEN